VLSPQPPARDDPAMIAIFLAAAAMLVQPGPPPSPTAVTAEDGYLQIIEKLGDGLWVIRQAQPFHLQPIGNVVIVEQDRQLVVIDGGGSPGAGRRIVAMIESVSPKPVGAIVVTHWHGDHTLGLSALAERWPKARIIASAQTRDALLGESMQRYPKGAPDPNRTSAFLKDLDGVTPFIDGELAKPGLSPEERAGFERTRRELADYRRDVVGMYLPTAIEAHAGALVLPDPVRPVELFQPGRANTDGDTAVWLPRQAVLASGDIVVAPVPFGFGSYPADWIKTLEELKARDFAILIPGHGAPMRDTAYVDRLIALISTVREQVTPLVAQGLDLAATRRRIDLGAARAEFTRGDPWLGRWFDQYWRDPFVEAAWREAKGLPIVQGKG
jgi:glyoxylase-like metal-dependent hydrolase (beta-lactamase superfamily II)